MDRKESIKRFPETLNKIHNLQVINANTEKYNVNLKDCFTPTHYVKLEDLPLLGTNIFTLYL